MSHREIYAIKKRPLTKREERGRKKKSPSSGEIYDEKRRALAKWGQI